MRILCALISFLALLFLAFSCGKKSSGLETFGLRTFEIEMAPERVGEMLGGAFAHIEVPGRLTVEGREYAVKIRAAGSSTIVLPKKSLDLDFGEDDFEGAEEVRLSTSAGDPSMLRVPLALEIFKAAGLPTSKWEYVSVFLNRRPLGLYIRIEKVDKSYFKKRKIPWTRLYKAEQNADFLQDMESRLATAFSGKPEPQNLERMALLTRVAWIADEAEFEREVFAILSRESAVRYMVATQLTNHYDGFNKNINYVERADTGLLEIAPWDFDLVWRPDLSSGRDAWNRNHLWKRLYALPSVKAAVDARVAELSQEEASRASLDPKIEKWSSLIGNAHASDPYLGGAGKSLQESTAALQRAMEERLKVIR